MSTLQNNAKAQKKLDDEKAKIISVVDSCSPLVKKDIEQALSKEYIEAVFNVLKKWYYILSDISPSDKIDEYQTTLLRKVTEWLEVSAKNWKK